MRGSPDRLLAHEAFALDHETCAIYTSASRIEPVALTLDIMTVQGGSKHSKKDVCQATVLDMYIWSGCIILQLPRLKVSASLLRVC